MKYTLTIMPDYGGAYCWRIGGDAEAHGGVGSCSGLPMVRKGMRMHPNPMEKEFEEWQAEFDRTVPGQLDGFEWRRFHAEGISLARRLKVSLGNDVRVIYEKPFEDPDHEIDERREVLLDGDLVELPCRRETNAVAKKLRNESTQAKESPI